MNILTGFVAIIYYVLIAFIAVVMVFNLLRSKSWQKEILYIVVLIPLLLRLFRLK